MEWEITALLEKAIMAKRLDHREAMEELTSVRKDERIEAFWEEELIQSMLHKAQGGNNSLCDALVTSLAGEASRWFWAEVGQWEKYVEEDKGPAMVDHYQQDSKLGPKEVGLGSSA